MRGDELQWAEHGRPLTGDVVMDRLSCRVTIATRYANVESQSTLSSKVLYYRRTRSECAFDDENDDSLYWLD